MTSPTDTEIAWAAGLFEGEGTIFFYKAKASVNLALVSTDEDVVRRFNEVVGVGNVYAKKKHSGFAKKQQYVWATGAICDARHVARLLSPWFGKRRREQVWSAFDSYNTADITRHYGAMKVPAL